MAKISAECIDAALEGLKNFTREELEDYTRDVFNRARSYEHLQNAAALEKAMDEINNEQLRSLFEDTTIKANNVMKFEKNAADLRSGKVDMRGLIAARGNYLAKNLSNAQKQELEKFYSFTLGDLNHEEMQHLMSGKFDEEIADVFDGKKVDSALSKRIADKLKDYFTYRNAQLVLSNAMKYDEINEDRFFRAIHDQQKVVNGAMSLTKIARDKVTKKYDPAENKLRWRNFIKKYLDMEGTFSKTKAIDLKGKIDTGESDKILSRIYDNITTGKSQIFTRSVVANDREAIARKSRMFFKWKNMRSLYDYNKTYGRGNLFNMLMSDMQSSAKKVGIAKLWGENPYSMFNDLRTVQQESDPKSALWWHNTDNYLKALMGLETGSPNLSNSLANLKMVSTMARLPLIALQSVSDIGYIASFAQRMGINYFKAYGNLFQNIFNAVPNEERKRIAELFKTQVDSHLGYIGRWANENNASGLLNRISTAFFKVNMLHAFDKGNRVSIMHMMSKHLAQNSKKLSELSDSTQRWIGKFLNENEWNLLRKKNQNGLFTTDNVDSLTDQELRDHYQTTDKSTPLSDLRDDLHRKVYSMFVVASENAVLSPTEFEKAFLWQGQPSGKPIGELLRLVTHFKMYTMAFIDRVLVKGFQEADGVAQKLNWGLSMLIGTMPLSYMSTWFSNALMGLSMPDYDQMNVADREKYLLNLMAPSLAIFSGMLDPRNQNQNMLWSMLASPSTNLIGSALAAPTALALGNPGAAKKMLMRAANYVAPIQTTPIVSPFIRQALGQESHLDPGQQHLFGQ